MTGFSGTASCPSWARCPSARSSARMWRTCTTRCGIGRARRTGRNRRKEHFEEDVFPGRGVGSFTPQGRNPCRSVRKYKERKPQRFLSAEEYQRLGRVLDETEAEGTAWSPAIAAIRLLILTRMPAQRDPVATMGRRGPDRRRVAPQGRENGRADGAVDPHGGCGAGCDPADAGTTRG